MHNKPRFVPRISGKHRGSSRLRLGSFRSRKFVPSLYRWRGQPAAVSRRDVCADGGSTTAGTSIAAEANPALTFTAKGKDIHVRGSRGSGTAVSSLHDGRTDRRFLRRASRKRWWVGQGRYQRSG